MKGSESTHCGLKRSPQIHGSSCKVWGILILGRIFITLLGGLSFGQTGAHGTLCVLLIYLKKMFIFDFFSPAHLAIFVAVLHRPAFGRLYEWTLVLSVSVGTSFSLTTTDTTVLETSRNTQVTLT